MKTHETEKVNALLDFFEVLEESREKVLDCIQDKECSQEELIELLERIKNWED